MDLIRHFNKLSPPEIETLFHKDLFVHGQFKGSFNKERVLVGAPSVHQCENCRALVSSPGPDEDSRDDMRRILIISALSPSRGGGGTLGYISSAHIPNITPDCTIKGNQPKTRPGRNIHLFLVYHHTRIIIYYVYVFVYKWSDYC